MNENMDKLANELINYFNGLLCGTLPSKVLETGCYIVTVSSDPDKLKIEDKKTHEIWKCGNLNSREIALLALLAHSEGL